MKTSSHLLLSGALGALSFGVGAAGPAVDTSQWKCESCPFEKEGTRATLQAGVGAVSDDSARFGDYTGLQRKGGFVLLDGEVRHRGADGFYANAWASDLGLDIRSLAADIGQEGRYRLRLGYAELPRHLLEGAATPFLGVGGSVLTMPPGYDVTGKGSSAAIVQAAPLREVEIGTKRSRLDAALAWRLAPSWSARVSLRHEERDGTQRLAGSFFSTTSHLVAPVDQVTDQLEVSAAYTSRRLHASLAYQASLFRNGDEALTWSNPFAPVLGGDRGQMALAPDNQFHQIVAKAGYEITPTMRASADIAFGRMTQDADFLAATLNPALAATLPALPANSLNGRVDTFNASARLTAAVTERLRLNASYARDVRDNRTHSAGYPALATDMFLGSQPRSNQPFSFTLDRFRLNADYRAAGGWKVSAGIDEDDRERTLQEVVTTRETTVWGRLGAQPLPNLALALKLAHAQRRQTPYGIATWVDPAENPLLRKFNLAERKRNVAGLRADLGVGEGVQLGLSLDLADDDYDDSPIGLRSSRSANLGLDVAASLTDQTQLNAFAQSERIRSRQSGSQVFSQPDWSARTTDTSQVFGIGARHLALKDKLELRADLTFTRSRSKVGIDAGPLNPPFPVARTALDSLRLQATYRLRDDITLVGSLGHEALRSDDWRIDGVLPSTVANLLAFGDQAPHYRVNVLRLAMRYRF